MITLLIRRPDIEETALSPDEMLVALRDGVAPVGEVVPVQITAPRAALAMQIEAMRSVAQEELS